jgi:hypothetical protein
VIVCTCVLLSVERYTMQPFAYPPRPSAAEILLQAAPNPVGKLADGGDVCTRTFTASNGHRAVSAITSAEALAAKYKYVR